VVARHTFQNIMSEVRGGVEPRVCRVQPCIPLGGDKSGGVDIVAPVGMCTPIVNFHMVFHGEVGDTSEAYGP